MGALQFLETEIKALDEQGLLRSHKPPPIGALVMCSNDYLGYASDPWLGNARIEHPASGAGASRLVSGEFPEHARAEQTIASWLDTEAALLFSSGYAANVGTISALAQKGDVIVSDALNHASIIDGCRLSGATVAVVPHNNPDAVARALDHAHHARRRWVVTESYFSMDGDAPDLKRLRTICDHHGAALIVDEAHAIGTLGPAGRGIAASMNVAPDVLVGTLGKSIGLQGAFVAGPRALRTWLWNRARSFVFSTGISPSLASAIHERVLQVAQDEPRRERLEKVARHLRTELARIVGPALMPSDGPILPVFIGAPDAAVRISNRLRERGVLVQAIRPPTVPTGTSRLRITAHARLSDQQIELFLNVFRDAWSELAAPAPRPTIAP
ncbi:MAG: 8-amino-7-oxononanoate synthase [Polyangiaceae bacterium]|nr:8-amino-7-oxononanoate synthase [Polyangiaceae bacterium]